MPTPQQCIYPYDSILEDYISLARTVSEAADCFLIGSLLPLSAAIMGRGVWMPWTARSLYPNLFSILCGIPGNRKTTTVELIEDLAGACLPPEAFLPKDFSPEALFDEYDDAQGGRCDKLLLVDDASVILTDWQNSSVGQRNAVRFLDLYDCKGFSEAYRRNQQKNQPGSTRRRIPATSTSVVLGSPFSMARFENQAVRAGLQRRFLYYVAEKLGRKIPFPKLDQSKFGLICDKFSHLGRLSGPFRFSTKAATLFEAFQDDNRNRINNSDPLDEALLSRLASTPAHVLKVAMIFEACRSVKQGSNKLELEAATLQLAIDHVAECEKAVARLDTIAQQPAVHNDAVLTIDCIRAECGHQAAGGEITLAKSRLTRRFANRGGSNGRGSVKYLYGDVLPT
jgi:hypothetical protein